MVLDKNEISIQDSILSYPLGINYCTSRDKKNDVEEESNIIIEKNFDFKFYFPSLSKPSTKEVEFKYKSAIATIILQGTSPTVLFCTDII